MVDWWALGILVFEMIVGCTPFYNKSRQLMLNKIKTSWVAFPSPAKFNIHISHTCQDFIVKCLEKKKSKRLGAEHDVDDIISHPWFDGVDKKDIIEK